MDVILATLAESSPCMPLPSAPNNDLRAARRGRDRATCAAAATAGEIAFRPLGKHLFWLNERPRKADSSSAFAADSRGNLKK
jgi:hypothetical protein